MPWHIRINGQQEEIVEQDSLKDFILSQCQPTDIIIVQQVDYIQRQVYMYGPGGLSLPPKTGETPTYNTFTINHLTTNGTLI